jgi:hypothetical protein
MPEAGSSRAGHRSGAGHPASGPGAGIEVAARTALEKVEKYSSMVGYGPVPRFHSTFCDETNASKAAQQ